MVRARSLLEHMCATYKKNSLKVVCVVLYRVNNKVLLPLTRSTATDCVSFQYPIVKYTGTLSTVFPFTANIRSCDKGGQSVVSW